MEWIFKHNQIHQTAAQLWKIAANTRIFAFHGAMGTGKTTFIHALCDVKQVKDVVGSPTFSIINEYVYSENGMEKKIIHIDLYRLKDEEEAVQAGVVDCLYSGHTCLVEWPEKAPAIFPDNTIHLFMGMVDAKTRHLKISNI